MILGKVAGSIWSTINHPFYDNRRLLLVELIDDAGKSRNDYVIAVDLINAGVGDHVLILDEGTGARQLMEDPNGPVRSVIVSILDSVR